jgi:hypothetical protein
VSGTLYAVEQLGRTARLTIKTGEHFIEVALKPDLTDVSGRIGDRVWMSLCDGPLYVFDAATTRLVATSRDMHRQPEPA